jgi:putative transposon-encoded protein
MSEEEKDIFEKINNVEETLKTIFGEAVHIETKTVKAGGTSNNVYVPKKFAGNPVTLIIWDRPNGVLIEPKQGDEHGNNREEQPQPDTTPDTSRSELSSEREEELQE